MWLCRTVLCLLMFYRTEMFCLLQSPFYTVKELELSLGWRLCAAFIWRVFLAIFNVNIVIDSVGTGYSGKYFWWHYEMWCYSTRHRYGSKGFGAKNPYCGTVARWVCFIYICIYFSLIERSYWACILCSKLPVSWSQWRNKANLEFRWWGLAS